MANSERERKWKEEIKEVLAGADEVHSDLLLWLAKGPDRLTSKVYSLKSRVKDEKSLFRKIRHKIKEEGKEYSAKNATDIIGLRLLCLNNDKLPALVEGFVRFIEACQRGDVLFERGSLADAIVEIKIYQSQDNLLVYEDIHARLLLRRIQNAQERPKIELEKSTDEDPYSSVHFVCRLRGEKGKRFFSRSSNSYNFRRRLGGDRASFTL